MIRISANNEKLSIRAEGHAGYAAKGSDIVCAAVSILVFAYAAVLMKLGKEPEIRDEGDRFEVVPEQPGEKERIAFETVLGGLRLLADEYESNVRIET